jgi:hypothetical protein
MPEIVCLGSSEKFVVNIRQEFSRGEEGARIKGLDGKETWPRLRSQALPCRYWRPMGRLNKGIL